MTDGSNQLYHGWYDDEYRKYIEMSIWDPRYTYCRFFFYDSLEQLAKDDGASWDYVTLCKFNVMDKFYNENFTSRFIMEQAESVCSSFSVNSRVFLFSKISYGELAILRDKVSLFADYYDYDLPDTVIETTAKFLRYMDYTADFLQEMYNLGHRELWKYYIVILNDVEMYFMDEEHGMLPDKLREVLTRITEEYYSILFKEYDFYESKGVEVNTPQPDSLTRDAIELDRFILLDFLNDPQDMEVNREKYLERYSALDVVDAYNRLYGFKEESVYRKLERCVNRIEDMKELAEGLCCYSPEVMDAVYDAAKIILELDDDAVANYVFNFFYLPSESAAMNGEYKVYLDNYQQFLSTFKELYEAKVVTYDTLCYAVRLMDMEVDDVITGIKNEITEDIMGSLLKEDKNITLLEEVGEVEGIKVYKESTDTPVVNQPNQTAPTAKKMNLGGN